MVPILVWNGCAEILTKQTSDLAPLCVWFATCSADLDYQLKQSLLTINTGTPDITSQYQIDTIQKKTCRENSESSAWF